MGEILAEGLDLAPPPRQQQGPPPVPWEGEACQIRG